MESIIGIVGVLLGIALVMYLIFKGWNMGVVSVLAALVVIITNRMGIWSSFSESYAESFKNFAGTWFLMFTLSAAFGKIMEESGASTAIANSVIRIFGTKNVILVILVITLVLSYGGISTFVIAFTIYPICLALFAEADIPKKIFPGLALAIPATITMAVAPGTPAVQNMIPTEFFGTNIYAAPVIGIVCSVFIFICDYFFYNWAVKDCKAKGEHFVAGPKDVVTNLSEAENLPGTAAAYAPIVILLVTIFIAMQLVEESNYAVVIGMSVAVVASIIIYRGRLVPKKALSEGFNNGFNALMITSAIMGFGGVVSASPSFKICVNWLLDLKMSPLVLAFIAINIICMICGSSSGGLNIFLNNLGEYMMSTGINPQILHRLCDMASAGLDAMPFSSGVVMANTVADTEMKNTYQYTFVSQCLIPLAAFGIAFVMYKLGLC